MFALIKQINGVDLNGNLQVLSKNDDRSNSSSRTKKPDIENLKKELVMDEHRITIQELCDRLQTNSEDVRLLILIQVYH